MSLRQHLRIRWLIFKRILQLGRPLTATETYEVMAVGLNETDIIMRSVGALTLAWAQVETILDYCNGVLIMHEKSPESELPKSLRPKIGFFRKSFDRIPELSPFRERVTALVSELNRLKTIRHDIVHGVALERMPVGTHKVLRIDYQGKTIKQWHATYGLVDIVNAANEAMSLRTELLSLFRDVLFVLYPDQAKQIYG
jgi:hypothetical protein